MFKWFSKRQLKEQRKLLYQNSLCADYLLGYFHEAPEMRTLVEEALEANRQIAWRGSGNVLVGANDLEMLLEINKNFRRLYDQTAGRHVQSFDEVHKPTMGWEKYYEFQDD